MKKKLFLGIFTVVIFLINPITAFAQATQPFRFVSWGDAQDEGDHLYQTSNSVVSLNPSFTIFNGDFSNDGVRVEPPSSADSMQVMIKSMMGNKNGVGTNDNGILSKTFFIRGNHDNHISGSAALWENYFNGFYGTTRVLPAGAKNYVAIDSNSTYLTYSFDFGNSRFIGIDVPGNVSLNSSQINFLNTRLTEAENKTVHIPGTSSELTHAFIYFHGPIYCVGEIHCDCTKGDSSGASCTPSNILNVINSHPIVSATFHGHEHNLGWTHMDKVRLPTLVHEYDQFMTSPSGQSNYIQYSYPERFTYEENSVNENIQGFATVDVDGLNFSVRLYRIGDSYPLACKQMISCVKNQTTGSTSCTNSSNCNLSNVSKIGDVNNDNQVNIIDIGILIDNFGKNPILDNKADINKDGKVNIVDIGIVVDNYGK